MQRKINSGKYQTFLNLLEVNYKLKAKAFYFCSDKQKSGLNKLTLKYEPDLDFVLIAITAPLKDYRLCFRINRQLSIDFRRIDELALLF